MGKNNTQTQMHLFKNPKARIWTAILCGAILLIVIIYWRNKYISSQEYVEFETRTHNSQKGEMKSKNYQLDTQEISPALK